MISAPVYCRQFIGRREQMTVLDELYDRAAAREQGSVILISGEAGIGKTRLVREFSALAEGRGSNPALAQCLPFAQASFAPFATALRTLIQSNADTLRTIPVAERAALHRLIPEIDGPDSNIDKTALLDAFNRVLLELSSKRPCVVILEDLHWADAASLELLQLIASNVSESRLFVIATYRSDELRSQPALRAAVARLSRMPSVWRIDLEPLSETEMRAFMQHALEGRSALSPRTLETIRNEAEGNPLNAEELLKTAVDEGGRPATRLPLSLTDAVVERLDRFEERDRHVLVCASAVGRRFTPEFLAAVVERPIDDVASVLKKAVEFQLLIEDAHDTVAYVFRHALTRDAIHQELLAIEARPLHAKIASVLESEDRREHIAELAYHAWEARDLRRAAQYNELAGDAATIICGFHEAATSYERALEAVRKLGESAARLERKLAMALFEIGEGVRALQMLSSALAAYEAAGDSDAAAQVCRNLGDVYYHLGDAKGMLNAARRGIELTRNRPQSTAYFKASIDLSLAYNIAMNPRESLAALQAVESLADAQEPKDRAIFYIRNVGVAGQLDDPMRLQWAMKRAVDAARDDVASLVRAYSNCANNCLAVGLEGEGLQCVDAMLQAIEKNHMRGRLALSVLRTASMTYLFRGRFHLAQEPIRRALLQPMEGMESLWVRCAAVFLGVLSEDRDLLLQAQSDRFVDDVRAAALDGHGIDAAPQAAQLLIAQGQLDRARVFIHELVESAPEFFSPDGSAEFCVTVARYGESDDIARAREFVHSILPESGRRLESAYSALFEAYAALRNDDAGTAREFAARAELLFDELHLPYFRAQALEIAGRTGEALQIYRTMRDIYDVHRLEKRLTTVNKRGRTKTELTFREREVAELVAEGRSNAAIAERLVISERTVEHHVAAIFDKLGVASRAEVAAYVVRSEPAKR
jgi:DNA-binding CsgD family transcriptional regulator